MFTSPWRSREAFPRRCTSFAQLPLIAQRALGGAQQFANELREPGLSAVKQNTTNSAEDSLQVSRAPLLDWAMQAEVRLEIIEISFKNILRLTFCGRERVLSGYECSIQWRGILVLKRLYYSQIATSLK